VLKTKADVCLPFASEKQLASVVNALTPEIRRQIGVRSTASLAVDGLVLVLSVEAKDTVALRATLNAYLRWINSTKSVLETLEKKA